jgi:hypothetical protein
MTAPRTSHAQAVGALSDLRDLLSSNHDQNRALFAAVAALLPSPGNPALSHRADDSDAEARTAMRHGVLNARVLLGQTLEQVAFDLDSGASSLLDTLEACIAFAHFATVPVCASASKC